MLGNGRYILGPEVASFEERFAEYLGIRHVVGVASGTDALHLALRACGIGAGDAVLTVSHTSVATVAAIEMAGAVPVFVDIDPESYTLDPAALDATLNTLAGRRGGPVPKAVIAVHLYGYPADMKAIDAIARRFGLRVIEDCAQAHGARLDGAMVGSFSDISAFSFYPTKNLGAIGDAGAVATADAELAERVRALREYGWRERHRSEMAGVNSRLDELQAAVLSVKLAHLESENARRREIASRYDRRLALPGVVVPAVGSGVLHAYHQYVVRVAERDHLRKLLAEDGIGTLIHYPVPVHRQPAYAERLRLLCPLPRTEQLIPQIVSLPIFPELVLSEVERVCQRIAAHVAACEPARVFQTDS